MEGVLLRLAHRAHGGSVGSLEIFKFSNVSRRTQGVCVFPHDVTVNFLLLGGGVTTKTAFVATSHVKPSYMTPKTGDTFELLNHIFQTISPDNIFCYRGFYVLALKATELAGI